MRIQNLRLSNFLKNGLIIMSAATTNFSSYLWSFDIDMLSLSDSTAVGRYFFSSIILFILITSVVRIFSLFASGYISPITKDIIIMMYYIHKIPYNYYKTIISIINYGEKISKNTISIYIISSILFLLIYIGLLNSIKAIIVLLSFFFVLLMVKLASEDSKILHRRLELDKMNSQNIAMKKFELREFLIKLKTHGRKILYPCFDKDNYIPFFIKNIGIFILTASILIGFGRASYVKDTAPRFHFSNSDSEYIIFLSTNSGVILFNKNEGYSSFITWEGLEKIDFPQ